MTSTADVLEESIRATEQQKQAAEQVSAAMVQIRTAAEQLAAEGVARAEAAETVTALVADLERGLQRPGLGTSNGNVRHGEQEPVSSDGSSSAAVLVTEPAAAANGAGADATRQR